MKFEVSRNARRQIDKIQNRWTNDPELGKFYAATKRGPVRRILLIEPSITFTIGIALTAASSS